MLLRSRSVSLPNVLRTSPGTGRLWMSWRIPRSRRRQFEKFLASACSRDRHYRSADNTVRRILVDAERPRRRGDERTAEGDESEGCVLCPASPDPFAREARNHPDNIFDLVAGFRSESHTKLLFLNYPRAMPTIRFSRLIPKRSHPIEALRSQPRQPSRISPLSDAIERAKPWRLECCSIDNSAAKLCSHKFTLVCAFKAARSFCHRPCKPIAGLL